MFRRFLALLRKDWRQARLLWLVLAVWCVAILLGAAHWPALQPERGHHPLSLAIGLALLPAAVMLAADAIAGERKRGHLDFLLDLPVDRRTVFLSKLAATLAGWLALVGLVALLGWLLSPSHRGEALRWTGEMATWGSVGFASCFFLSAWVGDPVKAAVFGSLLAFPLTWCILRDVGAPGLDHPTWCLLVAQADAILLGLASVAFVHREAVGRRARRLLGGEPVRLRSRSAALAWKEWREARAIVLALAAGMLALHGVRLFEPVSADLIQLGLLCFGAALLGGRPLAGEAQGGTLRFLMGLPVSPGAVWRAKLKASVLWLAVLYALWGPGALLREDWWAWVLLYPCLPLVHFALAFLLSAAADNAILACAGGFLGSFVVLWLVLYASWWAISTCLASVTPLAPGTTHAVYPVAIVSTALLLLAASYAVFRLRARR
ncbi:MAG: hypothetical protein FJ291_01115 [Planctomycetes bacterium]|nr:hypothetical protein [Planctomycetota bacterium]